MRLVWRNSCQSAFGVANSELFALRVAHQTYFCGNCPRQTRKVVTPATPNAFSHESPHVKREKTRVREPASLQEFVIVSLDALFGSRSSSLSSSQQLA
jgi:hypothetical protein